LDEGQSRKRVASGVIIVLVVRGCVVVDGNELELEFDVKLSVGFWAGAVDVEVEFEVL